jgi:hypothetical protein
MALIATRRRGFETSRSPATGSVLSQGRAATVVGSTGGGSSGTIIFDPGDLGSYATHDAIFTVDTNDHDGGISSLQSVVTRPGGSSKAIRIQYPNDEAGTQLQFPSFTATPTLYYRWYMKFGTEWIGHFPVGLKTSRSFTTPDYTAVVGESASVLGDAYCGPKFVWMRYADPNTGFNPTGIGGNPSGTTIWGLCVACMNLDVGAAYSSPPTFTDAWHLFEVYQQINSGNGVGDGKLELRVDKQVIYQNNAFKWVDSSTNRWVGRGLGGWRSMWFGGNYSGADFGFTSSVTLNRYEDGYFVSTDARWVP